MKSTINSKEEVLTLLRSNAARLRAFGVKRIGLFGSFVRGTQGSESDIDLLVEFAPGQKNFDRFLELSFFLEDLLTRKVELVTVESLSPHIGPHILQEVQYVPLAA